MAWRLLAIMAMALLPAMSLVTSVMYSRSVALMMRYCSFFANPSATVTCKVPWKEGQKGWGGD